MMDWADERAESILGYFHDDLDEVAAALRKAKAHGMREAAERLGTLTYGSYAKELYDRASEIEKGNT